MRRAALRRLCPQAALRRLDGAGAGDVRLDDGVSLVETVVALLVFALFMTALGGAMVLVTHASALSKARNAATTLAQQVLEQDRALGLSTLSVCSGGGSPLTYQPSSMSSAYSVVTGSSPCVPFSQSMTNGGYKFTVKQYILSYKSYSPGSGVQPEFEKLVAISVTWTSPVSGSYELDSTQTGQGTVAASSATGLQFNVDDSSTNPATLITDDALVWDYTVTDSTSTVVASGQIVDGTSSAISVNPGTYTCQAAAETDAASSYYPDPANNAGLTLDSADGIITGSCTVTANNVTQWTTMWLPYTSCVSSGTKGSLQITVTDQTGKAISGATVTLTNANGNAGTPGALTTSSTGVALFSKTVPDDLYTYAISKTGYQSVSGLGPVCVTGTNTATAVGSLTATTTCASVTQKGSVTVTVVDENGLPVNGAQVTLSNQSGGASPASTATNASGVATFSNNVNGDSYTYTVSKTNYTSPGPQGPICVVAGTTTAVSTVLPTQAASGCASTSTKGSLQVTVTDQLGNPVSAVQVSLTNANGHSGTPGAVKTNASGVALFNNNVPGDLFYYNLSPPAGYTNYGTQGPVCVVAGQTTTATAVLQGIMTVKVSVQNSDIQPVKSYTIKVTDSNGNQSTNSVTVNKGKIGTVTFSNMPTDSAYTIEVCVPVAATGNCDDISNTATTYDLSTINHTYTVSFTDAKGGA